MDAFHVYRAWWGDVALRRPFDTARTYRGLVMTALAEIGADPRELTPADISRYLSTKRTQTANLIRCALADLTAFLVRHGYRAEDPLAEVPRRRQGRKRVKRGLSAEEVTRLVVAACYLGPYRHRWEGQRFAWLLLAQFYTGLRPGELVALTTANIDLENREIRVTGTKTGEDRIVPLSSKALEVFTELCRDRVGRICSVGRTQYWHHVKRAAIAAGLPPEKCRPYALRHSFASSLVRAGVHQRVISELMGHADPRSTMVYTIPDEDLLRNAVEVLP